MMSALSSPEAPRPRWSLESQIKWGTTHKLTPVSPNDKEEQHHFHKQKTGLLNLCLENATLVKHY